MLNWLLSIAVCITESGCFCAPGIQVYYLPGQIFEEVSDGRLQQMFALIIVSSEWVENTTALEIACLCYYSKFYWQKGLGFLRPFSLNSRTNQKNMVKRLIV